MAVKLRHLYRLSIAALIFTIWVAQTVSTVRAQQKVNPLDGTGNHLTIRIDTLSILPGESDVFVNVYYTFTTTKPHILRGYNAHFFFDSLNVRIVDMITDGTASKDLGFQEFNPKPPEAAVVTLGDQEIDLSNPVLFKVRLSVSKLMTDTTFLRWVYIDIPDYFGVDTPIVLQDGWIRRIQPKVNVVLTTPDAVVQADSALLLPLIVSDLTNANLQEARLSLTVDTSIAVLTGAVTDSTSNAQITSIDVKGESVIVDLGTVTGASSLSGDTLLWLKLKANPRSDTVCSAFTNGSLAALNSNALVGTTTITFGKICVEGQPVTVPLDAVPSASDQGIDVQVFPNPVRDMVRIHIAGEAEGTPVLTIYDLLGREVYRDAGTTLQWQPNTDLANGAYHMIVRSASGSVIASREIVLKR